MSQNWNNLFDDDHIHEEDYRLYGNGKKQDIHIQSHGQKLVVNISTTCNLEQCLPNIQICWTSFSPCLSPPNINKKVQFF